MTEEELKAALDEAGVEYDGRWGVEKLQAALDEAQRPKGDPLYPVTVLRDFWPEEDKRVRKGQVLEVTAEEAMAGIEEGRFARVK